jgi:coenzyme F420-reducing hydrogenase delta subunit
MSCNWNGWSCIEGTAGGGDSYPSSVRAIKVSCLSRVHAGLILQAFEFGADGVMLLGCEPDTCHFGSDKSQVLREIEKAQDVLAMLGIRRERLALLQLPAFSTREFINKLTLFCENVKEITKNQTPITKRIVNHQI